MVKTPRTRHSKSEKEPVTIDLEPDAVSRVSTGTDGAERPQQEATDAQPVFEEAAGAEPADAGTHKEPAKEEQPAKPAASGPEFGRREPAAPPPPQGRGRTGALAAGVAGGAAVLLVAGGLHVAGLLPLQGPAPQDGSAPAVAALEAHLAELRAQVTALEGAGAEGSALAGRVAGAEERVSALDAAIEALRAEIAGLEADGGEAAPPVDLSPLEARIAAMETALGEIDASGPAQAELTALGDSVAALREELAAARETQAAASARLDALEGLAARLGERLDEQAQAPSTAIIIAASALKAAIDRGTPFSTELDTFASLAPEAPQLDGLRAHAAAGVATRAQLAAESDAAANAMIAAAAPADPDAGVVDRLWASAMGLVQVRPVGMVEGEGVPETVARLDAAVAAGDYERAIAEFATLPEASKEAGAAFMARLQARHDADRLVDAALAAALKD